MSNMWYCVTKTFPFVTKIFSFGYVFWWYEVYVQNFIINYKISPWNSEICPHFKTLMLIHFISIKGNMLRLIVAIVTIMSKCHRKRIEICIGVCKGTLPGIFYDLLTVSFVSAMIDKCLTFIHILINLSSINPLSFTFGVPNILESYLK